MAEITNADRISGLEQLIRETEAELKRAQGPMQGNLTERNKLRVQLEVLNGQTDIGPFNPDAVRGLADQIDQKIVSDQGDIAWLQKRLSLYQARLAELQGQQSGPMPTPPAGRHRLG
ncbi:MAG TPA: hypothetical protein VHL09_05395 [Dehalococcoidia bacterium]|nr:hypothetical protein [Dehalococcoidia bacterium]